MPGLPSVLARPFRKLAVAAGSLLVALGLAELGARAFLEPLESVQVVERYDLRARLERENLHPRRLEKLSTVSGEGACITTPTGRRLRANLRLLIRDHSLGGRDIEVRTNSLGYRGPEPGPKVDTRVLLLGDSIVCGDYLREEETLAALLRDLSRDDPPPVEVLNAGVPSVGLGTELAVLLETGLGCDPDVVLLGFYLNDFEDSRGVRVLRPPDWLAWSRLGQRVARALPGSLEGEERRAYAEVRARWMAEVGERFPPGPGDPRRDRPAFHAALQEAGGDWGAAWSAAVWEERIRPLLGEFARLSRQHGFRLLALCFPVRLQVEAEFVEDTPQRSLASLAEGLGVPVLDLLPALRAAYASSCGELFFDHCHHTPLGTRLIAGEVHRFLRDQLQDEAR